MLKFEIPMQWHRNCTWIMNQRTFALLLTMSDAIGRPLLSMVPQGVPAFTLVGSPVVLATWMPDVAAGSTPIAIGDWKAAYTLVNRRATSVVTDPYSAGYCTLFKFSARVGGSPTCSNAARLLRIR